MDSDRVTFIQAQLDRIQQGGTTIQENHDMRHMQRLMDLIKSDEEFEPCGVNWRRDGF